MVQKLFARLVWVVGAYLFAGSVAATEMVSDNPYEAALPAWESTLQRHVDEGGRIDFYGVAAAPQELARFVDAIAKVSPDTHPNLFPTPQHVIAYHINAYNALAMQGVLDRDIPSGFTSYFKRASFFRFRGVVLGGETTNLYTYENKVIRPLGEPRTHFALNCMVKDCPRLPRVAFRPETLDTQLDTAAREFFASTKYLQLDAEKKIVRVSAILKFYTKDFVESGKANDLVPYLNHYAPQPVPSNFKVKFLNYDWRINQQPR